MVPPQVGMRLQTIREKKKKEKEKKEQKEQRRKKKRRGTVTILYHTCALMTHKYRGSITVLLISKSVEPNEEQKEMTSGFQ